MLGLFCKFSDLFEPRERFLSVLEGEKPFFVDSANDLFLRVSVIERFQFSAPFPHVVLTIVRSTSPANKNFPLPFF